MKGKSSIGLWIIGVASAVVVAIIALVVITGRTPVSSEAHANIAPEWINGNELGSPDAPVVMVAYEDFLCPHCGEFNKNGKARMIEDFIEDGKLRLVFKFFPLDIFAPGSYNTARAGQCIIDLSDDPNGFWQYHDTLFFGERGACPLRNREPDQPGPHCGSQRTGVRRMLRLGGRPGQGGPVGPAR